MFVTNKVFTTVFTERNLVRYENFININFIYANWIFRITVSLLIFDNI